MFYKTIFYCLNIFIKNILKHFKFFTGKRLLQQATKHKKLGEKLAKGRQRKYFWFIDLISLAIFTKA